jgi:Ni/Fe-hydrogenase subunit HybB-like protein
MTVVWKRDEPIDGPLFTRAFWILCGFAGVALLLSAYREFAGLGAVTALNDGYSWGLFKNFNVTTLTALGSGGYAVGVLTWVLNRQRYHVILRTAVLTSLLGYGTAMLALGVDVGRPWNFMYIADPRTWNSHSPLLEVAVCMTAYFFLALDVENAPPVIETIHDGAYPSRWKLWAAKAIGFIKRTYPFGIAIGFVLPSMHQSSLGTLLMLAGPRVHPVWQTPLLPLLYLLMAYVLGFAFVIVALMLSCLVWRRSMDLDVLGGLAGITSWMALLWMAVRLGDLAYRGQLGAAFSDDFYGAFFLIEFALILVPAMALRFTAFRARADLLLEALLALSVGGALYRYAPTTIAFLPGARYSYFPSVLEIVMSLGFTALGVVGFLVAVKRFAILPAPAKVAASEIRHAA